MTRRINRSVFSALLLVLVVAGCGDPRLVQQAERASERQADQNRQIARQNQELAQATNQLITADAQARRDALHLQRDLHLQQTTVDRGRDALEQERQTLATDRRRDSLLLQGLGDVTYLLACLAPLLLGWYVLRAIKQEPVEEPLAELLVCEFTTGEPILLPFCAPAEPPESLPRSLPPAAESSNPTRKDTP